MWVNSDFSELLSLFNANQIEYLVIGGYAVIKYTEPRYTKDLGLWLPAFYRAFLSAHGSGLAAISVALPGRALPYRTADDAIICGVRRFRMDPPREERTDGCTYSAG